MNDSPSRSAGVRRLRRAGVQFVRSVSLTASRAVNQVIDPVGVTSWLIGGAASPSEAASRAVIKIDGLVPPAPVDVVANYLRGRVLFGLPNRADVRFEYRWDPERGVIDEVSKRIPKRIRTIDQRLGFEVRSDVDFEEVIQASRRAEYTWITDEVKAIYERLFGLGFASCIGVYQDGELVGGLWGLEVGRTFGLMSVFHKVDHAGSMALIAMVNAIGPNGRWDLVDTGLVKPSFERFGARWMPVDEFTSKVLSGITPTSRPDDARET